MNYRIYFANGELERLKNIRKGEYKTQTSVSLVKEYYTKIDIADYIIFPKVLTNLINEYVVNSQNIKIYVILSSDGVIHNINFTYALCDIAIHKIIDKHVTVNHSLHNRIIKTGNYVKITQIINLYMMKYGIFKFLNYSLSSSDKSRKINDTHYISNAYDIINENVIILNTELFEELIHIIKVFFDIV